MIEVRGVNTHNKGAHLMMLAIADVLGDETQLTIAPNGTEYADRSRAGYRQTVLLNQAPRISRIVGNLVPSSIRSAYGLVSDRQIDGVLDAAGFAYSDSFSPARAQREAKLAEHWARRGVPLVFLPQAFGPFQKPEQRRWSKALLEKATLIFARDRVSLAHLEELGLENDVRLAPDFTVGLNVSAIPRQISGSYGAIVPNEKLVTQGRVTEGEYVESLAAVGRQYQAAGLQAVVVIHEFNDQRIGSAIGHASGAELFTHRDPLVLKRVLGDATVAVASRFHAVVGALALNTPVAAYGWSHKYEELMADFGVPEWAVKGRDDLEATVSELLTISTETREALAVTVSEVKKTNTGMWADVRRALAR